MHILGFFISLHPLIKMESSNKTSWILWIALWMTFDIRTRHCSVKSNLTSWSISFYVDYLSCDIYQAVAYNKSKSLHIRWMFLLADNACLIYQEKQFVHECMNLTCSFATTEAHAHCLCQSNNDNWSLVYSIFFLPLSHIDTFCVLTWKLEKKLLEEDV